MNKIWRCLPLEKKIVFLAYGIGYLIFGIWISAKITTGFENMGRRLDHLEMRIDHHIEQSDFKKESQKLWDAEKRLLP